MKHIQFLKSIATTFLKNVGKELKDYCFVFPNRRSGVFFEKYLKEANEEHIIMPRITSISELVSDLSGLVECGRIELMFDLYEEYVGLYKEELSFDEFTYWGEVVLNDFNDVDLYMVNATEIFKNIKEYKEIGTDYLTDEQKSVLQEYFGESEALNEGVKDRFWKHSSAYSNGSANADDYFKLWEGLGELYTRLNERLEQKGMAYSGRMYRNAVENVRNCDAGDFDSKQYVFVGFNILSTSEIMLFDLLKKKEIADFYWDCNSPALKDKDNRATRFLNKNKSNFKSKYIINEGVIDTYPEIHVKALPSNAGQVKYASAIVDHLIKEGKVDDKKNLIDTAIVLPDENLFIPLSGSISKDNRKANITMGYLLKKSLTASLLTLVAKLHRQARLISGEYCYYNEDVKEILSHPFIKIKTQVDSLKLLAKISKEKSFYVNANDVQGVCVAFDLLFKPIVSKNVENLSNYVGSIMEFIKSEIIPTFDNDTRGSVEKTCAQKYIEQFYLLLDLIGNYKHIEFNDSTFFYLFDRFISNQTVAMQGEPLEGLQIMGVLETRCLDFKNVIVLSMNERVFPRKHFSRSFIPYTIRKAYKMSTIEHQESMYAYYFYRMISRAENVYLLYDARSSGLGSGDPSRYIQQLTHLYCDSKITTDVISFDIKTSDEREVEIIKDDKIMSILNEYRTAGSGKYLSASSIKSYMSCPVQFYLDKVVSLPVQEEKNDFIEASTFGTIIHEIMKRICEKAPKVKYEGVDAHNVTREFIIDLLKSENHTLDGIMVQVVNREYNKKGDNCDDKLDGIGFMIYDALRHYVEVILKYDRDITGDFIYIKGEKEESGYWSELNINFKQYIDRIDVVKDSEGKGYLRIIDYKTGNDETSVSNIKSLFDSNNTKNVKCILQVMLYCDFYNYINGNKHERIKPMVYTVKDMSKVEIKIGGSIVENYQDERYYAEFMELMKEKLAELFDKNVAFKQTSDKDKCEYCKFKMFCGK